MNDKPTTDEKQDVGNDSPVDEQADARFADDLGDIAVDAARVTTSSRIPMLMAAAALILSVVALVSIVFLVLRDSGSGEQMATVAYVDQVAADVQAADAVARGLQQRMDELAAARGSVDRDIEELERSFEQRLRSTEGIEGRVAGLESSFAALRGISTGVRDAWLLAEAEYYMQIANAQAQLAGNPDLAALALSLADETLRSIADPGLIEVRRALAGELQQLEAVDRPDVEGATLTLASLATVVGNLPLKSQQQSSEGGDDAATPEADLEGTERAIASLKNAISGIVTVRRTDEAVRPLMAPEAAYFLRANLSLQLQSARLGLLRGEQAVFQQSLDDALEWLREYYDVESMPVKSALLTLSEIRNSAFTAAMPDLSGSLRLLREYSAFRSATERPAQDTGAGQPQ
jgi:uroporphyrin-III C-methyltransferase